MKNTIPKPKHTELPWALDKKGSAIVSEKEWFVKPSEDEAGIPKTVINLFGACGGDNPESDIDLIIKSVNCHNDLLEALIEIIKTVDPQDVTTNKIALGVKVGGEYYVGNKSVPSDKAIHMAINAIKKTQE